MPRPAMLNRGLSVILSSYNQPNALQLALPGFAAQEDLDFEMIVADDGSDADVRDLVFRLCETMPFPVKFLTQPREGFRKARILNKAILEASGEQILFCDGDCVPLRSLVSAHRRAFREGCFTAAGVVYLTLQKSNLLTPEGVARGEHEKLVALWNRVTLFSTHTENIFSKLIGKRWKPKIKGANFSADRQCLLAVDGFDEAYNGRSGVDSDMRNRLRNLGCPGVSLWHEVLMFHLDHELDPRRRTPDAVRLPRDRELYYGGRRRVSAIKGISFLGHGD
jgi:glycosyltransferase involved in cell wall biosynthesis